MIKHYNHIIQRTPEWHTLRCGLLTASEMDNIITPKTLTYSAGAKKHLYELLAQRITKYVEPHYVNDDMIRGQADEADAKVAYEKNYAKVTDCGFITNDRWGFIIGYSPDGLVGNDGQIEIKSRRQKFQIETILSGAMPSEFLIQVQTGLLVSERKWCDFISYCGGMPMFTLRIEEDMKVHEAIAAAAAAFHENMRNLKADYSEILVASNARLIPTEHRPPDQEIYI